MCAIRLESFTPMPAGHRVPIELVYIGPLNEFSDCTVRAINNEIGDFGIARLASPEAMLADTMDLRSVKLVLIHQLMCEPCFNLHDSLKMRVPNATFAIACTSVQVDLTSVRRLLACDAARGILPFNLKLDIWLSALRLLLSGGDYVPLEYAGTVRPLDGARAMPASQPAPRCSILTQRETDVLRLVAEGMQNKTIASRLELSEHTIKLHIHHIISKLGVHNRTEAAAIYLNDRSS
jgi:DNA-binding NarL/FixJ family response regulator